MDQKKQTKTNTVRHTHTHTTQREDWDHNDYTYKMGERVKAVMRASAERLTV